MAQRNTALRTLYIFNGLFVIAGTMLAPIYALFAEDIGADIFTVSLLAATFLIARLIVDIVVRAWGDRIREHEYMWLGGFLIRACSWFALAFVSSVPGLFLVQVILGFGEAIGTPSFNTIFAEHLDKGKYIAEYADWDIVAAIASAVGAMVGGYIVSSFGFPVLFIIMSALAIIAFFGVLATKPPRL